MISQIIGFVLACILWLMFFHYLYKKENEIGKTLLIFIEIITFAIITLYFADITNLPSKLKWVDSTNSREWFNFIATCISSLFGTLISGFIVLITTIGQLSRTEDNEKETKRINNMPFLQYKINVVNNTLNLKFKNIGNNTIKKYNIKIKNENILSNNYQNSLAVNEETKISYKLPINEEKLNINIEYQDLLCNTYNQQINISYKVNNEGNIMLEKVKIEDEKLEKKKKLT